MMMQTRPSTEGLRTNLLSKDDQVNKVDNKMKNIQLKFKRMFSDNSLQNTNDSNETISNPHIALESKDVMPSRGNKYHETTNSSEQDDTTKQNLSQAEIKASEVWKKLRAVITNDLNDHNSESINSQNIIQNQNQNQNPNENTLLDDDKTDTDNDDDNDEEFLSLLQDTSIPLPPVYNEPSYSELQKMTILDYMHHNTMNNDNNSPNINTNNTKEINDMSTHSRSTGHSIYNPIIHSNADKDTTTTNTMSGVTNNTLNNENKNSNNMKPHKNDIMNDKSNTEALSAEVHVPLSSYAVSTDDHMHQMTDQILLQQLHIDNGISTNNTMKIHEKNTEIGMMPILNENSVSEKNTINSLKTLSRQQSEKSLPLPSTDTSYSSTATGTRTTLSTDMKIIENPISWFEEFQLKKTSNILIINKIPQIALLAYHNKLNTVLLQQKLIQIEEKKRQEIDYLWKEYHLKQTIVEESRINQYHCTIEKEKIQTLQHEKNELIKHDFIKLKEDLFSYMKSYHFTLKEIYGDVITNQDTITRKFMLHTYRTPQPIEFRIHILRAIKTKLPAGYYVMMVTQYDELGGLPLSWSKYGLYGIDTDKPAVTACAYHGGRYYDRILKLESSCYALCPPRAQLKPSYVFVFELFQLASKNCPTDRIVAWSAMPMCSETLTIIEGKFKLPLLRGQSSPFVTHFTQLEEAISSDLNNWLCNMYFEVQHLSPSVLNDLTPEQWEPPSLEIDYISKNMYLSKRSIHKPIEGSITQLKEHQLLKIDKTLIQRDHHQRHHHHRQHHHHSSSHSKRYNHNNEKILNALEYDGNNNNITTKAIIDDNDNKEIHNNNNNNNNDSEDIHILKYKHRHHHHHHHHRNKKLKSKRQRQLPLEDRKVTNKIRMKPQTPTLKDTNTDLLQDTNNHYQVEDDSLILQEYHLKPTSKIQISRPNIIVPLNDTNNEHNNVGNTGIDSSSSNIDNDIARGRLRVKPTMNSPSSTKKNIVAIVPLTATDATMDIHDDTPVYIDNNTTTSTSTNYDNDNTNSSSLIHNTISQESHISQIVSNTNTGSRNSSRYGSPLKSILKTRSSISENMNLSPNILTDSTNLAINVTGISSRSGATIPDSISNSSNSNNMMKPPTDMIPTNLIQIHTELYPHRAIHTQECTTTTLNENTNDINNIDYNINTNMSGLHSARSDLSIASESTTSNTNINQIQDGIHSQRSSITAHSRNSIDSHNTPRHRVSFSELTYQYNIPNILEERSDKINPYTYENTENTSNKLSKSTTIHPITNTDKSNTSLKENHSSNLISTPIMDKSQLSTDPSRISIDPFNEFDPYHRLYTPVPLKDTSSLLTDGVQQGIPEGRNVVRRRSSSMSDNDNSTDNNGNNGNSGNSNDYDHRPHSPPPPHHDSYYYKTNETTTTSTTTNTTTNSSHLPSKTLTSTKSDHLSMIDNYQQLHNKNDAYQSQSDDINVLKLHREKDIESDAGLYDDNDNDNSSDKSSNSSNSDSSNNSISDGDSSSDDDEYSNDSSEDNRSDKEDDRKKKYSDYMKNEKNHEIYERGYDSNDEQYLTPEDKSKLSGHEWTLSQQSLSHMNTTTTTTTTTTTNSNNNNFTHPLPISVFQFMDNIFNSENELSTHHETSTNKKESMINEYGVVKKWNHDGARLDSEAIAYNTNNDNTEKIVTNTTSGSTDSPRKIKNKNSKRSTIRKWHDLIDAEDMETYTPAIAADPSMRKKIMPTALVNSKLKYMYLEAFGDLEMHTWGSFKFYVTIVLYIIAIWVQIYVHYLGQYLYLLALKTPVYGFKVAVLYIQYKYVSTSISTLSEMGTVLLGMLSTIIAFLFLGLIGYFLHHTSKYIPESIYKFIIAYGIATILNPYTILIIDLIFHHYDCNTISNACHLSYSSRNCNCYNGDFIKLWYRMLRIEGSGITGLLITLLLYFMCTIISSLLVYMYLIHIHRNAHILDIWRRVHSEADAFFVPDDYEVTYAELRSICLQASKWRGLNGSIRKVVLHSYKPVDSTNEYYKNTAHSRPMSSISGDEIYQMDGHTLTHHKICTNNTSQDTSNNHIPHYIRHNLSNNSLHTSQPNLNTELQLMQEDHHTYIKHYQIIELDIHGNTVNTYRQFIIQTNGAIIEIFDQYNTISHSLHKKNKVTSLLPQEMRGGQEKEGEGGVGVGVGVYKYNKYAPYNYMSRPGYLDDGECDNNNDDGDNQRTPLDSNNIQNKNTSNREWNNKDSISNDIDTHISYNRTILNTDIINTIPNNTNNANTAKDIKERRVEEAFYDPTPYYMYNPHPSTTSMTMPTTTSSSNNNYNTNNTNTHAEAIDVEIAKSLPSNTTITTTTTDVTTTDATTTTTTATTTTTTATTTLAAADTTNNNNYGKKKKLSHITEVASYDNSSYYYLTESKNNDNKNTYGNTGVGVGVSSSNESLVDLDTTTTISSYPLTHTIDSLESNITYNTTNTTTTTNVLTPTSSTANMNTTTTTTTSNNNNNMHNDSSSRSTKKHGNF